MIIFFNGQADESPEPAPQPTRITKRAFLRRLTEQEYIAIDLASRGDTPQAAAVRYFIDMFKESPYFDTALDENMQSLLKLQSIGLLESGRPFVILNTPPEEDEIFR